MIANFISHNLFHVQKISQIIYSIGHILFIGYNQSNNLLPLSWPLFIPLHHHYFAIGITAPHRRATTPTPNNFSCLSYYPAPPNAPLSSSSPPMDSHHLWIVTTSTLFTANFVFIIISTLQQILTIHQSSGTILDHYQFNPATATFTIAPQTGSAPSSLPHHKHNPHKKKIPKYVASTIDYHHHNNQHKKKKK